MLKNVQAQVVYLKVILKKYTNFSVFFYININKIFKLVIKPLCTKCKKTGKQIFLVLYIIDANTIPGIE